LNLSIVNPGESIAIVLALVGAVPVKEGTGRVVRYDLVPLKELGRPRIDILASMSGIFRYVTRFFSLGDSNSSCFWCD
jgi:magnesium chelatase subunit H